MNAQPDFEVRLFNPSTVRSPKLLGYAFSFARMNRRMHNKALIVDGAAAIVGGRNIGDPYFQIGTGDVYVDADVLGVGASCRRPRPRSTPIGTASRPMNWNGWSTAQGDLARGPRRRR